jgi:hypothetical protein
MTISDFVLYQNYPNPFNPSTKIGYQLKQRAYVKLMVYDIKGELISVLVNKEQNAGYYEVEFVGNGLPSVPNTLKKELKRAKKKLAKSELLIEIQKKNFKNDSTGQTEVNQKELRIKMITEYSDSRKTLTKSDLCQSLGVARSSYYRLSSPKLKKQVIKKPSARKLTDVIWLQLRYSSRFLMRVNTTALNAQSIVYFRDANRMFSEDRKQPEIIVVPNYWLLSQTSYGPGILQNSKDRRSGHITISTKLWMYTQGMLLAGWLPTENQQSLPKT